ncbi:MAG TPA: hypothetical protein VMV90_07515 [Rectinemataceae bacterium]|nr:hypothetical protein [Rectinemataceae bacterium]
MTINRNLLRQNLETAQANAYRLYALHGENELSKSAGCYASGRYDGLRQAIEIVDAQPPVELLGPAVFPELAGSPP